MTVERSASVSGRPPNSSAREAAFSSVRLTKNSFPMEAAFKMARGQLAHFSRPDYHGAAVIKTPQDFLRQFDPGLRNRHRAFANFGFRPHAFSGGQGELEQLVENGARCVGFLGGLKSVFHLR